MKRAAFAGSFDPPTLGHLDIIKRGSKIFDKLLVVVAANPGKKSVFTIEERVALLADELSALANVSIAVCPAGLLLVDFLREKKIDVMVRGLRDMADFSGEYTLATINNMLSRDKSDKGIETVFLPTRPELSVVSSSGARIIAEHAGNVSVFLPPKIAKALNKKIRKGKK